MPDYAVANLLQVDACFVRTQSSTLEKRGFLCRQLNEDGKVMRFSLTIRARKHMDRFTRYRMRVRFEGRAPRQPRSLFFKNSTLPSFRDRQSGPYVA